MQIVSIMEVCCSPDGQLSLLPSIAAREDMEFIWRMANGVRWDSGNRRLVHVPDSAPDAVAWFGRFLAASRGEYGYQLTITPETRWIGVPAKAREAMEQSALVST
jgi:hypothetical protein